MKPVPILTALCLLSACGTPGASTPSADRLPPSLTIPCADATTVPERDLTRAEVTALWLSDRRALAACRSRHAALVAALSLPLSGP